MQIRADELDGVLARQVPTLIWIHGDEPLLSIEAADAARRAIRAAGAEERRVFEVDRRFRIEELAQEAEAMSLFAAGKLLELRLKAKPGKETGNALAALAPALSPEVRLLVTSPRLDRAATSGEWFATITRLGCVVTIDKVDRNALPRWIGARLARQKQSADNTTLEMIADRVEGNLLAAHQEVQKLGLLCGPGKLPAEEARAAVLDVARYDPWSLAETALSGDVARTVRCLDGLRAEGQPEPLVLWVLADAARTLHALASALDAGRPLAQAKQEARLFNRQREMLFERALRRLPADRIALALQCAAGTDRIIKGIDAGDAWASMLSLALLLAGTPARLAAPPVASIPV